MFVQVEKFIDEVAEKNVRRQFFALITLPPSKMSYWMKESALLTKPYFSKVQDLCWWKTSANFGVMQCPSGPSNISDSEYQVLYYFDLDNIDRKQKKSTVNEHFGFGDLKYLDGSDFPTSSFRSVVYRCPWMVKKTMDEEQGRPANLAEKPIANAEHIVSLFQTSLKRIVLQ